MFDKDDVNVSNCYGDCATIWPPYYAGALTQLDLDNHLNTITRDDNTSQTTYYDKPLYTYFQDNNVADTNGNFIKNVWHLIFPQKGFDTNSTATKLSITKVSEKYMVDAKGYSLYIFDDDNVSNVSTCYDTNTSSCATIWPPFYEDITNENISNDLNVSLFTTVTRTDGKKQISYNGKPLYYFAKDVKAGDINGDWIKSDWHLVQIK
jgi:predicted lipoprotein with Yx(FWY)xxD motif